jgi:hypothetical protein
VLGAFPPGTLFTVRREVDIVTLVVGGIEWAATHVAPPSVQD